VLRCSSSRGVPTFDAVAAVRLDGVMQCIAGEYGVVIPALREECNISGVVRGLAALATLPGQVVVVPDDADDPTGITAMDAAHEHNVPLKVVVNRYGCGIRNAVRTGVEVLGDVPYIVVMMGDGCDDPATIVVMTKVIASPGVGVVHGCRNMPGGGRRGARGWKPRLSAVASRLLWRAGALPTRDATNAFTMYERTFLLSALAEPGRGFSFSLELAVKARERGLGMVDVPTVWTERTRGASHFGGMRTLVPYGYWLLRALRGRLSSASGSSSSNVSSSNVR